MSVAATKESGNNFHVKVDPAGVHIYLPTDKQTNDTMQPAGTRERRIALMGYRSVGKSENAKSESINLSSIDAEA